MLAMQAGVRVATGWVVLRRRRAERRLWASAACWAYGAMDEGVGKLGSWLWWWWGRREIVGSWENIVSYRSLIWPCLRRAMRCLRAVVMDLNVV